MVCVCGNLLLSQLGIFFYKENICLSYINIVNVVELVERLLFNNACARKNMLQINDFYLILKIFIGCVVV